MAPFPHLANRWARTPRALVLSPLLGLLFGFTLCQAAQYSALLPAGTSLIGNPLNNGNNAANLVFPNPDPGQTFSGPFDGDALEIYNCTNGTFHTVYFDSLIADTPTGFTDTLGNPVPAPILTPGCAFFFFNQSVARTFVFNGTIPTPVLPPPCNCGCGILSYVSLQGTNAGTFQSLTGFAPSQGDQLVSWNGAAFTTNTFLNGAWTGPAPVFNPAIGYGVIIPCSSCASVTNEQFSSVSNAPSQILYTFDLANNTAIPVTELLLVPQTTCFTVTPDIVRFQPPLQPGQAASVSVTLTLNQNCGTNLCLLMSLEDSNLVNCCSTTICFRPDTSKPFLQCPAPVTACGPSNGLSITLTAQASDPDGDPLTIQWLVDGALVQSGGLMLTRNFSIGQHSVEVTASDGQSTVNCSTTVTVQLPPQVHIQLTNGLVVVSWTGAGVLQSAGTLSGPWSDVKGATSPYTVQPAGTLFYRIRCL
jgi:hypothetical protein